MVGIMFHAWWPSGSDPFYQHNIGENTGRINYYDLPWVPFEYTDGILDIDFPPTYALFQAAYDERKATPTTVSLELEGILRDTNELELTISASTTAALPAGDYRLHVVLTESELYFDAPNGVDWHEYTMRDMIPDQNGSAMTFAGGFPQSDAVAIVGYEVDSNYQREHCQIVYFLQSHETHEVFQAGAVDLIDLLDMSGTAPAPAPFALGRNYPNPFNPSTTIPVSVEQTGSMRLDILDAAGRLVRTLHEGELASGDTSFRWDGRDERGQALASGVYLARLSDARTSSSRRLVLLK